MTLAVSIFDRCVRWRCCRRLPHTHVAPHAALQENSRGTVGGAFRRRARAGLVVAEVALAVTLTIGAGLLLRSFVSLLAVNPGFRPEQLLTWQMNLPDRTCTRAGSRIAFYRDFLARMKALPGVVSVGGTSRLPLGSTGLTTAIDVVQGPRPVAEWPEVQFRRSVGDYFQTMGIPFLRGRTSTTRMFLRRRRSASSIRRSRPSSSPARIRSASRFATARPHRRGP